MDARIVRAGFDLFIRTRWKNDPALMLFTLTHERRHLAEENVLREAKVCARMPRLRFDRKKLEMLIAAGASIFCDLAKAAKEKQLMTAAELKRLESKAGELAETQAMVDEWKKEALSTAVTGPVASRSFDDGAVQSPGAGDQLEGSGGDGPADGPVHGDLPVPRPD